MKCSKAKKLFSGFLDDELKSSQKNDLQNHLFYCLDCRYDLAKLRASMELIHGLPEVAAPKNFWNQISEKIAAEDGLKEQKKTVKWFFPGERLRAGVALAAVLVIVLGISSLIYGSANRQEPGGLLSKKTTSEKDETYKLSRSTPSAALKAPATSAPETAGKKPVSKTEQSPENNDQTQLEKSPAEENNRTGESGDSVSITDQNTPALGSAQAQQPRRTVTRISLKLKADQYHETITGLNTLAKELGGRLKAGTSQDSSTQMELTAPVDRATEALAKIGSMGEISDKKQEVQDVTEEYLILQKQKENLQQEKEKIINPDNDYGTANTGNSAPQEELNKLQPELDQTSLSLKKLSEEISSVHFLITIVNY